VSCLRSLVMNRSSSRKKHTHIPISLMWCLSLIVVCKLMLIVTMSISTIK
jgi:hypothetical protein